MSGWNDIEQLMLDLKQAQDSTTTQKLSERNCIEILLKLQKMKLLEVIHTMDGKEYITPTQLTREIKDELYIHGGRISLVELQSLLNVDFSHIEAKANDIVSSSNAIFLVLGQLVDKTYLDHLAEEINDTLQSLGQVRIADLCKSYDLPGEFLISELVQRLGNIIDGKLDETNKDAIFTEAFIARHKANVRGMLSALTRPTALQPIIGECGISNKLFFNILEELIAEKRIKGDIIGKSSDKSTFLPEMYTRIQNQSVDTFYQQNGYVEYEMLRRLGIDNAESYIRSRFKDAILLKTVGVGPTIVHLVGANIDETLASGGWVDMQPLLPPPFSDLDSEMILSRALKERLGRKKEIGIVVGSVFASLDFQSDRQAIFQPIMKEKAEIAAKDATVFALTEEEMEMYSTHMVANKKKMEEDNKDDIQVSTNTDSRKKREKGGAGSGIGGREMKTKGKDKKRLKKQREADAALEKQEQSKKKPTSSKETHFMDIDGLLEVLLKENTDDCPENLLREIAERLYRPLNDAYKELANSVFQLSISERKKQAQAEQQSSDRPPSKKSRRMYEEEVNALWTNIRLFNDAYDSFSEESALVLKKHLLKTLCTDLTNLLFNMVGSDYLTGDDKEMTSEIRIKILTRLPAVYHSPLKTLEQTLSGKSVDEFKDAFTEAVSRDVCSVMLKKLDKKKERQVLHGYKMSLVSQSEEESDPGTVLHLSVAIMFQNLTGKMLHMPGKCVPQVVLFLRSYVSPDVYEQLTNFQTLVIKSMAGNDPENLTAIAKEMPKIRSLAASVRKNVSE